MSYVLYISADFPSRAMLSDKITSVRLQRLEAECNLPLADWLLGSRPPSSGPVRYQASENPEDWLFTTGERVQVSCVMEGTIIEDQSLSGSC